jgi:protein gp37
MNRTKIQWCDWTWNPIVGCSPCSAGCAHCYAAAISHRFHLPWGKAYFHEDRLDEPCLVRKPGRVFVSSMSDIGHETVLPEWRRAIYDTMARCPAHTFILLTKRPAALATEMNDIPRNVWVGVSLSRQDEEGPTWGVLRFIGRNRPVLFVSVEPMLEPITLRHWDRKPHWIICGPETGPKARPFDPTWARDLYMECRELGIPYFDKRDSHAGMRLWPDGTSNGPSIGPGLLITPAPAEGGPA